MIAAPPLMSPPTRFPSARARAHCGRECASESLVRNVRFDSRCNRSYRLSNRSGRDNRPTTCAYLPARAKSRTETVARVARMDDQNTSLARPPTRILRSPTTNHRDEPSLLAYTLPLATAPDHQAPSLI